jgi:hypothetical protein
MRFNINNAKKCGAKTRSGKPCQSPAMKNGRCKMHGGKSTGAKTKQGIENIKKANLKHGFYTKGAIQDRKLLIDIWREERRFLEEII